MALGWDYAMGNRFLGLSWVPGPSVHLGIPRKEEGVGSMPENKAIEPESGQSWGWARWRDEDDPWGWPRDITPQSPQLSMSRQE